MNAIEYTGLIIIGAICLVALAISYIRHEKKKAQTKKMLQEFDDFIIKNDLTIDIKQKFSKNIIGIDRLNYVLVFLNKRVKKFHLIRLKELADCRLVKERSKPGGHINRIFLKCRFKQKGTPDIILPFYNALHDDIYKLLYVSKRAVYWAKRINIFRETASLKEQNMISS